jgi:hypothetical protein
MTTVDVSAWLDERVREIITKADVAGVALDDGNIIDLLADNIETGSLDDLRASLLMAGYGARFPKAVMRMTIGVLR